MPARRHLRKAILLLCQLLPAAAISAEPTPREACRPLCAQATRAGLRVLEGRHLVLATDRPSRRGDGVDGLPQVFDEAFAAWCTHFRIDPARHADWTAFGCLVVDRERFRAAGLLPDTIPDFAHGYCSGGRFWMMDQSNAAYRRHLLLHEGVHAFTLTLLALEAQPWYAEGIAELLATHRLEAGAAGTTFVATPMPRDARDVEQLGRIEGIRGLRDAGRAPSLDEVFATPAAQHHALSAYATSWAAVALLALHPRHADRFARVEQAGLDAALTSRLRASPGWDGAIAGRDFDAFTDDIDYGYDFTRSGIDWSPGPRLTGPATIEVAADRGWQNSGVSLDKGRRHAIRASGRATVGRASAGLLESEPDGLSIDWYRGRPLGRLLAAQWVEPEDGSRPRFAVLAEGAEGAFTAVAAGPLYFKINEAPGQLADNDGRFTVVVDPQ